MALLVLTGRPGAGKTTLVKKIVAKLEASEVNLRGFYTQEIRHPNHGRIGFDVVLLSGACGPLARSHEGPSPKGPRVGKYTVDIASFEKLVLPLMQEQIERPMKFFIIDEVGKMELFSKKFETAVKNLLQQPSTIVIATIPLQKGQPLKLVEEIRASPAAKVYMVDDDSRDSLEQVIMSHIHTLL